jgi:hypothetical protein
MEFGRCAGAELDRMELDDLENKPALTASPSTVLDPIPWTV